MSRLYAVFLSSTYEDLRAERELVSLALQQAGHIPRGMELFPASGRSSWDLITDVIGQCDVYVLIGGGRYGSIDGETGLSFTEREWDYAGEQGIPRLAFLPADLGSIPRAKTDRDEVSFRKLESLYSKVKSGRNVKFYTNPEELARQVDVSVNAEINFARPQGYVRSSHAVSESIAILRHANHKHMTSSGWTNEHALKVRVLGARQWSLRFMSWSRGSSRTTGFECLTRGMTALTPLIRDEDHNDVAVVYLGRDFRTGDVFDCNVKWTYVQDDDDISYQHSIQTNDGNESLELKVSFAEDITLPPHATFNDWLGDSKSPNVPLKSERLYFLDGGRTLDVVVSSPEAGHSYSIDWRS